MAIPGSPSVLLVASECAPFAKAGGLGDVVGALPIALKARGHDVRVVLPRYDSIRTEGMYRHPQPMGVPLGDGTAWCAVYETRLSDSDVPVYLLDHLDLFGRGYLYDPPDAYAQDNLVRFAFLSRGAVQLAHYLDWHPDVFHVHDWPSALVPMYLNSVERFGPLGRSASVLTLHNVAHQARFPKRDFPATHLPWEMFRSDGVEDRDTVNPLKGGVYHATMLTAVSPRYAEEIRTPRGGAGLDPVLQMRSADLVGILNGIDDRVWDPSRDPHLAAHYHADELHGKRICKAALQQEMFLAERPDVPLIGVVSRLTDQKGIDVILAAMGRILALGAQLVILGSGDQQAEETLRRWSHHGGDRFRAWIGFSEALSHRIEAGADLFLMPSRFEPCGLNQMYSQRYGTLPIVRATGGLDDTVASYDERSGTGTGFKFNDLHVDALVETVRWAIDTYARRRDHFAAMQIQAMRLDRSWRVAAEHYSDVYRWALERRRWNER